MGDQGGSECQIVEVGGDGERPRQRREDDRAVLAETTQCTSSVDCAPQECAASGHVSSCSRHTTLFEPG